MNRRRSNRSAPALPPAGAPWRAGLAAAGADERYRRRLHGALGVSVLLHLLLLALGLPDRPRLLTVPESTPVFVLRPTPRLRSAEPPPTPAPRPPEAARSVPVPEIAEVVALRLEPVPPAVLETPPLPALIPALPKLAPPPPPEPGPLRFGAGMERPLKISGPDPRYTEPARRVRVEGSVVLETVIDRSGRVGEIRVLKPLPFGLADAAVRAVRQWRFEPARLDGEPVAVLYNLTVHFTLR